MNKLVLTLALVTLPAWAIAAGDHNAHGAEGAYSATDMTSVPTSAHDMVGMHGMHNETHALAAGMAGDPTKVERTIAVEMDDTTRFAPGSVSVKVGETVRLFIVNKGKVQRAIVIGTSEDIDEHAEMINKMPDMVHQEANQITLSPGQRGGIVWQFAKARKVNYASLVPGHKEAGMVGTMEVS